MLDISLIFGSLLLTAAILTLLYFVVEGHLEHRRKRESVIWSIWLIREQARLHALLHDKNPNEITGVPIQLPEPFRKFLEQHGEGV